MAAPTDMPQPQNLDWQAISLWTDEIAGGGTTSVRETFLVKAARGPDIQWNPTPDHVKAPQLSFLLSYWTQLTGTRQYPLARDIDALDMRPALGYVSVLDIEEGGRDFRYRVYGSNIAAVSGFDMTGQLVSSLRASAYVTQFGLAAFAAVCRRGEVLFTEHGPPATVYTHAWRRLVLPLGDENGAVIRLLVGNVPVGRDGRLVTLRL